MKCLSPEVALYLHKSAIYHTWNTVVMSGLVLLVAPILKSWFQFCYNIHIYSTIFFMKDHPYKKSFRTNNFGKFSVTASAIDSWNKI